MEKAWSLPKLRQGNKTQCIRHYIVNSSLHKTPSSTRKLTVTPLVLDVAGNMTCKLFHSYELCHFLFSHFKKRKQSFLKKSKSDKQGKSSCSLVWGRSWLVSMAPSPAQMGRSAESLEGRKSTRIAERELTFFLQAGCI